MDEDDEALFQCSSHCIICSKPLDISQAVRDHCHLTGKFRGAAHSQCNLQREVPKKVPIFFHNLKNFDSHILLKEIKNGYFKEIQVIPQAIDKFSAIMMDDYIFLDSFSFLPSSLDKLSESASVEMKNSFLLQSFLSFVVLKTSL